jgi:hypothetical protein
MSDFTKLHFADGTVMIVKMIALHRRRAHGRGIYERPTDWLARAGKHVAWGLTRREAFEHLREMAGADGDPPNLVQFKRQWAERARDGISR